MTEPRSSQSTVSSAPRSARPFAAGGWGTPVLLALCLAALAFAHRSLLNLSPRSAVEAPLSSEVENWFFEPSDTSPAIVMLLVGWLIYRRRGRLMRTLGTPGSIWGTALLFGAALASFYWSLRTGADDLQAITLMFEVLAAAFAFGGMRALRIVAAPAAVLLFAIPLPSPLLNAIVWKFQIWTTNYSGFLLELLGFPSLVSGDQIFRSRQTFQIIETCSGMRTVETLTLLTVLMIDLFDRRGAHAVSLLLVAPFVAFVVNGFRCLGLIFNPHSDIAAIHNGQGILMLLVGVLMLYFVDGGLERLLPQRPAARVAKRGAGRAGFDVSRWAAAIAGVLAILLMSQLVPRWQLPVRRPLDPAAAIAFEEGWRHRELKTDRMFLGQTQFLNILHRKYVSRDEEIELFVATGVRSSRYRSYHAPKTALPGTGWIVEAHTLREIAGTEVEELRVRRGTRRLLVHHWREGALGLGREAWRTALAVDVSPYRRSDHPVVVRISTPIGPSAAEETAGRKRLTAFAGRITPALQRISSPEGA